MVILIIKLESFKKTKTTLQYSRTCRYYSKKKLGKMVCSSWLKWIIFLYMCFWCQLFFENYCKQKLIKIKSELYQRPSNEIEKLFFPNIFTCSEVYENSNKSEKVW